MQGPQAPAPQQVSRRGAQGRPPACEAEEGESRAEAARVGLGAAGPASWCGAQRQNRCFTLEGFLQLSVMGTGCIGAVITATPRYYSKLY